jgi:hypothetical protein
MSPAPHLDDGRAEVWLCLGPNRRYGVGENEAEARECYQIWHGKPGPECRCRQVFVTIDPEWLLSPPC